MKTTTKLMTILLTAITSFSAEAASALRIEVAPLKLKADAEVIGLDMGVNGGQAIVFAGNSAKFVANLAGVTLQRSGEVLIMSGQEAALLVRHPAQRAAQYGYTTFVITQDLTNRAYTLAKKGVGSGVRVVRAAPGAAANITRNATQALVYSAQHPVALVSDAGVAVYQTGASIVGFGLRLTCGLIGFIGLNIGSCGQ